MNRDACSDARAILPLAVAREVREAQCKELHHHLSNCTACARLAKAYEQTWVQLEDWPDASKPWLGHAVVRALTVLRPPVWRLPRVHAAIQMAAGVALSVGIALWLGGMPADPIGPAAGMTWILAWMAGIAHTYIFLMANGARDAGRRHCYYLAAFGALGALALYVAAATLCPPYRIAQALAMWPASGEGAEPAGLLDAHMSTNTYYFFLPPFASAWFVGRRMPSDPENLGWTLSLVYGALALPSVVLQYEAFSAPVAWSAAIGAAMGAFTGGPIGMWLGTRREFGDPWSVRRTSPEHRYREGSAYRLAGGRTKSMNAPKAAWLRLFKR